MAQKDTLLTQIKSIQKQLANPNTPDTVKQSMKKALEGLQAELSALEDEEKAAASAASVTKAPAAAAAAPTTPTAGRTGGSTAKLLEGVEKALLAAPAAGAAVDEAKLKEMIQQQVESMGASLSFDKLKPLIEQYLETAREIEISIPTYGVSVILKQDDTIIPNFFKVIDDMLVGNNVYLIGEAGTGKTFLAERVAKALKRDQYTLNCSQYTTPIDIIGGETIGGFKEGKLLNAWEKGGILILDEMPKLDANTAGLFNDALAKSSKTIPDNNATLPNPRKGGSPIPRSPLFGCIATGNIYPNKVDMSRYVGNNQQDLSLLDRFSGGVYFVGYNDLLDGELSRYKFIFDLFVGSKTGAKQGLRYYMIDKNYTNFAVVSLRTIIATRVSFEVELVREIQRRNGMSVIKGGKTFADAIESYLVAFNSNPVIKNDLVNKFNLTRANLDKMAMDAIDMFVNKDWKNLLTKEFYKKGEVAIKELESMAIVKNAVTEESIINQQIGE
jgi:cobaltochelatase CobS